MKKAKKEAKQKQESHGEAIIERREFLKKASVVAAGTLGAAAIAGAQRTTIESSQLKLRGLNQLKANPQLLARNAIMAQALGLANQLGGPNAAFELSFILKW